MDTKGWTRIHLYLDSTHTKQDEMEGKKKKSQYPPLDVNYKLKRYEECQEKVSLFSHQEHERVELAKMNCVYLKWCPLVSWDLGLKFFGHIYFSWI